MDLPAFFTALATLALIYGLLTLGLNVQYGFTGLLNFGHVAFFAAGAFASALTTLPPPGSEAYLEAGARYSIGLGQPFLVGLLAAGVAGGLLALLIGATSVRLSSHYLAIATFAMAEIFRIFLTNEVWLTRGQFGITTVPQPGKGTLVAVGAYPYAYLILTAIVVAVLLWLTLRLTESPFGRNLRAVKGDELAARTLGKPAPKLKLQAFVLGGILAGMAGSLWSHSLGVVHVGQFVPIITFEVWLAMLMGGAGNNWGALLGAALLIAIREGTRFLSAIPGLAELSRHNPSFLPSLRFVLIGLLLILVVRFFPRGVLPERLRRPASTREGS
ncbi:MAG TPA: branched-chain amino acid ABC transporter permease [Trueperaceae bacterium]